MDFEKALTFHELTKHSYFSVRTNLHRLDWANKPHPFKIYENAEKISLPRDFPKPEKPVFKCFTAQTTSRKNISVETLASILFFTGGITRVFKYPDGMHYFRAAPATGALYPIELYVVVGDVEGLEPGVYHFDPKTFSLNVLRKGDFRKFLAENSHPAVAESSAVVVFTSIAWRNAWKYRERSYRHWFWDSGVMAANMFLTCNAFDARCLFVAGFVDKQVNKLLGIDGEKEAAVIVAPIGFSSLSPASIGDVEPINLETRPLSRKEIHYPAIAEIHAASSINSVEELDEWRRRAEAIGELSFPEKSSGHNLPVFETEGPPLWMVILRRGSTRKFTRTSISYQTFSTIVHTCSTTLPTDFNGQHTRFFVILNAVENIEPGAYTIADAKLVPVKRGEFRKISGYLCLEQELGADAAAVFYIMAPLEKILQRMGNRGYRVAQLEGGMRAGLIYLAAYGSGVGATGLTFYDDDVKQFFSPCSTELENMIVTAVGNPAYKANPGRIIFAESEKI
ncbi:MAG: SagB/ThcOx family dehydrogenase [Candidatus Caldarchaeum sp.]